MAAFGLTLALVGAGCSSGTGTTPTAATTPPAEPGAIDAEGGLVNSAVVSINVKGLNPVTIAVKKGDIVTWMNEDPGKNHQPVSDGGAYPGFDPGAPLVPGQSWTMKFDQVGTWNYHDANDPSLTGKVIVTE